MKEHFVLSNAMSIPAIGFGTFKIQRQQAAQAVQAAIDCGYRHIDGAAIYQNEPQVGEGIRRAEVSRNELFVTSKLWNSERGYDTTMRAFDKTLADLQLDYLDLYLIHWPAIPQQFNNWEKLNSETWRALERIYDEGRVKSIGVSNFEKHHLQALFQTANTLPMVNQIEMQIGHPQEVLRAYCAQHNIIIEAWSPLGQGKLIGHPLVKAIGEQYGKSEAQVCLRWVLQQDALPLVKSTSTQRMKENMDVFDFELSDSDMRQLATLNNVGYSGLDPDTVTF